MDGSKHGVVVPATERPEDKETPLQHFYSGEDIIDGLEDDDLRPRHGPDKCRFRLPLSMCLWLESIVRASQ